MTLCVSGCGKSLDKDLAEKLTSEFLYVDLLNNLGELAEDRDAVLSQARTKLMSFNQPRLQQALDS